MNENIIKLSFENTYGTIITTTGRYDTETVAGAIKQMLQTYAEYNHKDYEQVISEVIECLKEVTK